VGKFVLQLELCSTGMARTLQYVLNHLDFFTNYCFVVSIILLLSLGEAERIMERFLL